jgi:hypothetical protein
MLELLKERGLIGQGQGFFSEVRAGSTIPGETDWQSYYSSDGKHRGIFLDVDTSIGQFTRKPYYFTSLGGAGWHWNVIGATSIYRPTRNGFRVYLQYADGSAPTPEIANERKWHINWLGINIVLYPLIGSTEPGNTHWKAYYYGDDWQFTGLYTDVEHQALADIYGEPWPEDIEFGVVTSLVGNDSHWNVLGANAIYDLSHKGFRVYLQYPDGTAPTPQFANEKKWHINWCYTLFNQTSPGNTKWQEYRTSDGQLLGIYLDVDYSVAAEVPIHFTSLGGESLHAGAIGACSIYEPNDGGFRVYIRHANGIPPTPAIANERKWTLYYDGYP